MVLRKIIKSLLLFLIKKHFLNYHFSPHLMHAHLEQRYYTSDLSVLYVTSCR